MKTTIRVAIFRPDQEVTFETIRNDLASLQKLVGGYIEQVSINSKFCLICNEDGKLLGLPGNRAIVGGPGRFDVVCGTFFVARRGRANYRDILPSDDEQLRQWKPGGAIRLSF
jgi:hypothetical protein